MTSLWFIVPAHGRFALSAICLRQLRRTCDALADLGIEASAVVIADDLNLEVAETLGFGTVKRDNQFLSRKFNDGIQLACDPEFNPRPVDYVVPCGSDDWVHPDLFQELPPTDTIIGFQQLSFIPPTGHELSFVRVDYPGGCGIRIYPRQVMAKLGYRPADEDRYRACDTSTLVNIQRAYDEANAPLSVLHPWNDPRHIVDWKSAEEQLTPYEGIVRRYSSITKPDPFKVLSKVFPAEAISAMQGHYSSHLVAA